MLKTYKSSTVFSFPLNIGNSYKRIIFTPVPMGGAIYTTGNKREIEALEASQYFGTKFKVMSVVEDVPEEEVKPTPTTISVNDIEEAREYIHNNYEVPLSSMRSKKTIMDIAQEKGIVFIGI